MNAKEAPWRELLAEATARVRSKVSELVLGGEGTKVLGIGASGDKTLVADQKAEGELFRALSEIRGLGFLSEEAGRRGDSKLSHLAIIDPLDGSSNFERGIPFYCSSVAIAKGKRFEDITHAFIRDLVTGDAFYAERGRGATKNGVKLRTSKTMVLSSAVVGIDISMAEHGMLRRIEPLIRGAKRQVHYGANALELCYLADGRIDASIDLRKRMRITDFAAGFLIAKEAGATITGDGQAGLRPAFDLRDRFSYFATANPTLHRRVLQLCVGGRAALRRTASAAG
ncbi:MAG: inositol monophosphatase family protein [Candidatus Gagatemarchaeaceae archaeon]